MAITEMKQQTVSELRAKVEALYSAPLLELIARASAIHSKEFGHSEVQMCTLLSVKTGGCPEDCAYCPQSARHSTGMAAEKLLSLGTVMESAKRAREDGSTRFCMGAAWREVRNNKDFEEVLEMVSAVRDLGMEVCATLGMLDLDQARRLKEAGLTAYNHNLDTSEAYYSSIIHTRSYDQRLQTLQNIGLAGMKVCCGGIIGMGETDEDRVSFLATLLTLTPAPESIPINALVPVAGTPLESASPIDPFLLVRIIACTRILFPKSRVRLSAGRTALSREAQALAFLAGANSIFAGEKLLTTPNPLPSDDLRLFQDLGVIPTRSASLEISSS